MRQLKKSKDLNEDEMIEAAKKIQGLGAKNILVKGGHREDNCTDILLLEDGRVVKFPGVRIDTINTHGTGCTLSSSIARYSFIRRWKSCKIPWCKN